MGNKKSLEKANRQKYDEYYTLYQDIADEVPYYRDQLRGKRILCPCDWDESFDEIFVYKAEAPRKTDLFGEGAVRNIDLSRSGGKGIERELGLIRCNFVKFLVAHAEDYGLRSVSVSGYNPRTGQGIPFQSIDYSQYDLIITNPPFSLFREFIDVMMKKGKEFLVIGPQNAITYKECFEYIQTNRMWIGYHQHLTGFILEDGTVLQKNDSLPRCCCWYTNLDVSHRHDRLILTEEYSPGQFPKYYNYDAIEVGSTASIPCDYPGIMGVPITFLQKYNPEQFEIIGIDQLVEMNKGVKVPHNPNKPWIEKDGKPDRIPYRRIFIRNRHPEKP